MSPEINHFLFIAVMGYLLGCVQTSYLLGKTLKKIDIRELGTSNAGASNATLVLGWSCGLLTGFLDGLKGLLAVVLAGWFFPSWPWSPLLAGTSAILGHIFPFYIGFRGGKGMSTFFGMFLGIDWKLGLILLGIQVLVTLVSDYVALGSLAVLTLLPVLFYFFNFSLMETAFISLLSLFLVYKHASNISNIWMGKEIGLRSTFRSKKKDSIPTQKKGR